MLVEAVKRSAEGTTVGGGGGTTVAATIVICTRNRCAKLAEALAAMTQVKVPAGRRCQLIVVDNGSSDQTYEVCLAARSNLPMPLIYLHERIKGKSLALNRAVAAAQGEILVFTDDDCLPSEQWLDAIMTEFDNDDELAILGGRVEGWGDEQHEMTLSVGCERRRIRWPFELYPDPPIIGANMATRAKVFQSVGGYDTLLGPGARTGAVAEDIDLVYRTMVAGHKIVYSPDILVFHHHGRSTEQEIRTAVSGYHRGRGAFYMKYLLRDRHVTQMALRNMTLSLKTILLGLCRGDPVRAEMRFFGSLIGGALSRFQRRPCSTSAIRNTTQTA